MPFFPYLTLSRDIFESRDILESRNIFESRDILESRNIFECRNILESRANNTYTTCKINKHTIQYNNIKDIIIFKL